ncbi:MAG: branched-chain amino acid ABC transporter permease [Proteobacteria bacterium]|nr:branched-chain amino acid ABC transporter permease [Pseudomonadota bacterium]
MELLRKEFLSILIVGIISGGLAIMAPASDYNYYLIGLLTSACLWVIYVVCWDLLAGYTGMLNFGQLVFAGVAAYTVALLELHFKGARPLMILIGLLAGTCSSLLIGLPSLRVRAKYFALVSFAILLVFYRITMTFISIFGGDYGLSIPRVFSRETLYFTAIILMAITLISLRLVVKSRIGMALQSIREDEETARAVGINIRRYKLLACLISAFFTSLGGICGFYYMGHVGPEIFGMMGSFDVVIMGVIGGKGTIFGAALGGGVLSILLEFMRPVAEYRSLLYAILLVVVVMVASRGAWGSMATLFRKHPQKKEIEGDLT